MRERTSLVLVIAVAAACAVRPSAVADADHLVVVKSVRLPDREWLPWYTRFAEHCWVDVKLGAEWTRVEWNQHLEHVQVEPLAADDAMRDERWGRGVAVHGVEAGAFARELGLRILATAADFPAAADYRAWPGPNSNSFVDWLARTTGLPLHLPPNAVGKDYAAWLRVGASSSGSGVEAETALLGVQAGLREGLELHALGLTLGVGLWPPALKLPFLPAIPGGWLAPAGEP